MKDFFPLCALKEPKKKNTILVNSDTDLVFLAEKQPKSWGQSSNMASICIHVSLHTLPFVSTCFVCLALIICYDIQPYLYMLREFHHTGNWLNGH